VPCFIFFVYLGTDNNLSPSLRLDTDDPYLGNVAWATMDALPRNWPDWPVYGYIFGVIPATFGLSAYVLAHHSVGMGIGLGAVQLVFWGTSMNFFSGARHFYPYRPNPYVDAYDDPRSRHWLVPDARPARRDTASSR
jgi:hypothetical protein